MESSRIFVGNLSSNIENTHLQEEFSHYGTVLNVEIKSKDDFEGKIISKFAYVTIECDTSQLSKCVNTLDHSSWKGSVLKVEIAKESFLQRLKREREQNLIEKTNDSPVASAEKNFALESKSENHRSVERNNWNKGWEDDRSAFQGSKSVNEIYPCPVSKGIRRYDPTRQDHKSLADRKQNTTGSDAKAPQNLKFVQVSADLNFSGKSNGGFSLLERFSKRNEEYAQHHEEYSNIGKSMQSMERYENNSHYTHALAKHDGNSMQNDNIYDTHHPSFYPPKPSVKRKNFFVQANDPILSEGVEWLLTPLTPENLEEFTKVRRELVDLYKLRHIRAIREKSKNKVRKFQKYKNKPYKTNK